MGIGLSGWVYRLDILLLTEMRLAMRSLDGRQRSWGIVRLGRLREVMEATSSIEAQELDLIGQRLHSVLELTNSSLYKWSEECNKSWERISHVMASECLVLPSGQL